MTIRILQAWEIAEKIQLHMMKAESEFVDKSNYDSLTAENASLRAALEFYANRNRVATLAGDHGSVARQALKRKGD